MLKKLELTGFKSFANKTTLDFSNGITAVVGPNGSGKSNIIDALRWLLGERDAKHLRGGRVHDLIFAGTPKKPRLGMATASVYFDNSAQVFPVEFSEVVVSRVVDRGGNSSYFLNQAEVRLKDLVDFFARARLGVRGLVVIGQGESDMFLRANPLERREMIEEILGLREYQLKKAEAERKFKNTTLNLEAAEALIKEITPHLRALKRQTSRWARRSEIESELRSLESIFYSIKLAEIETNVSKIKPELLELEEKIDAALEEQSILQRNVEATEGSGGTYHGELRKIKQDNEKTQNEKSKIVRELGRLEAQIEFLREREVEATDEIDMPKAALFIKKLRGILGELVRADLEPLRLALQELSREVAELFKVRKVEGLTLAGALAKQKELGELLAKADLTLEAIVKKERELGAHIESHGGKFKKAITALQEKKDAIKELELARNKFLFEEERWRLKREDLELHARTHAFSLDELSKTPQAIPVYINLEQHEHSILRLRGELASMGEVDRALIKETHETEERHTFLTTQAEDLKKAFNDLSNLKQELEIKINTEFEKAIKDINIEFTKYFELMFGGGRAKLVLQQIANRKSQIVEEEDMETGKEEKQAEEKEPEPPGLDIEVSIPRKRIKGLEMLSGGERSLVSIAVLFALAAVSPPPFLVLDEMDAALDERNARRFAEMLKQLAQKTQFVLVTHNRATMEVANVLYGVTMGEDGTSKMLSLKLE